MSGGHVRQLVAGGVRSLRGGQLLGVGGAVVVLVVRGGQLAAEHGRVELRQLSRGQLLRIGWVGSCNWDVCGGCLLV